MSILYIIGVLALGYLVNHLINTDRIVEESDFSKLSRKLGLQLSDAIAKGDWENRQRINLKIIWLKTIRDVERVHKNNLTNKNEGKHLIPVFTEDEIDLPTKWNLDDYYCFPFSQEIIASYRKVLVENSYKGMYKPNNILPVSKKVIRKAIYFTFDYLNKKDPIYQIEDKDKLVENLDGINSLLNISFIETGNDDLPKSNRENYKIGKLYDDKQDKYNELNDLKLIDWRSEFDWIIKGIKYTNKELYDYAFACYNEAMRISPDNNKLKTALGITYFVMGESKYEKGEKENGIESIRMAAHYKNEEAIKWLNHNNKSN